MRPTFQTTGRNSLFLDTIKKENPDILILTETHSSINPGNEYVSASTTKLPRNFEGFDYSEGETRVIIYSKFPIRQLYDTSDEYTSVCCEVTLPARTLIIYGTIIGITGGKDRRFKKDFEKQKADIIKFSETNNICVAGDFNVSFSGYPYPSIKTIKEVRDFFEKVELNVLTRGNVNSPDHIAVSKAFLQNVSIQCLQIPFEKKVTDHSFVTALLLP